MASCVPCNDADWEPNIRYAPIAGNLTYGTPPPRGISPSGPNEPLRYNDGTYVDDDPRSKRVIASLHASRKERKRMSTSLYYMSGAGNESINFRLRTFPRYVEFLNSQYQIMGLTTLASTILAPAAFLFAPALFAVLITLIAIASGVGYFGMAAIRSKNYIKAKNPTKNEIENYWGFANNAFRNFDDPTSLWWTSASIITDYYQLLLDLKSDAGSSRGGDMIDSSLYACQQAYFEVVTKINRYRRFFDIQKHGTMTQKELEVEFAEIFEITQKVRENYENTLNYSIYVEKTNETLTPGAAETVLDSVNETLALSIDSLKQMDMYTGRNQLPSADPVEDEVDAARQRYIEARERDKDLPQAVIAHEQEIPVKEYMSKDEILRAFHEGKLDQTTGATGAA